MRIVALIQARMRSTRLPGKVLRDIQGASMLARVVRRVQRAELPQSVAVATSAQPADDAVAEETERLGVPVFRGDEQDVLDRFYQAARFLAADAVVRITADCPLVDPELIDQVVQVFLDSRSDYASNCLERTYPRGLDAEVMAMDALARAWESAAELSHRAHVTPYFYENPALFKLAPVKGEHDYSQLRWTVDTPEDLEFVRAIYASIPDADTFGWQDVLRLLSAHPELSDINRHIVQKALREG